MTEHRFSSTEQKYGDELQPPIPPPSASALATAALFLSLRDQAQVTGSAATDTSWNRIAHFRNTASQPSAHVFEFRGTVSPGAAASGGEGEASVSSLVALEAAHGDTSGLFNLTIQHGRDQSQTTRLKHVQATLSADGTSIVTSGLDGDSQTATDGAEWSLKQRSVTTVISRRPGRSEAAASGRSAEKLDIFLNGTQIELEVVGPKWLDEVLGRKESAKGSVICPMPSKVVEVRVKSGQKVEEGDVIVVLEAMKVRSYLSKQILILQRLTCPLPIRPNMSFARLSLVPSQRWRLVSRARWSRKEWSSSHSSRKKRRHRSCWNQRWICVLVKTSREESDAMQ